MLCRRFSEAFLEGVVRRASEELGCRRVLLALPIGFRWGQQKITPLYANLAKAWAIYMRAKQTEFQDQKLDKLDENKQGIRRSGGKEAQDETIFHISAYLLFSEVLGSSIL